MKKIVSLVLCSLLIFGVLALSSCGKPDDMTITVGATPVPHYEILEQVVEVLAKQGYTLKLVEYNDYTTPNIALHDGELDANFFQHTPYLNSFNASNNTDLVSAGLVHYEPFGVYGNGITSLSALADGATVIVPNDGSNETRALMLLAQEGLITLKDGVTAASNLTKLDIVSNPKNLDIKEVDADSAPAQLRNSDAGSIAVINGNYALGAGLKIADALAIEDASGEAAQTYANIIAVRSGDENSDKIKALIAALQSDEIAAYIASAYNGAVIAIH
ncbi:MAG: MetQ/NlpA family ABC transporter substrate-binding protein [Ruminococcus sp.]|nr:MetQ/NlpA family ABC transporter substrate-binding protein [Candidatus Apopatosoma intestinale]